MFEYCDECQIEKQTAVALAHTDDLIFDLIRGANETKKIEDL